MADSDRKIDEMFGMLHELKPVVLDIREGQKDMDKRVRATEIVGAEHGVKIDKLQDDFDGLGRKVRSVETRIVAVPVAPPPQNPEWKLSSLAEFFHALPIYWHYLVMLVAATAGFLIKHKP